MDLDGLDLDEMVRDVPLPFLRMLDLARALAFDPQLLLLDEITAALPPDLSERVFAVMERWKQRNRSVLFISHRLAEVRAHCDMCTVLRDGRDVASFVPGEGGEAQIVAAMLGEAATAVRDEVRARAATAAAIGDRPVLEAEHLGAGRQLDDVSLARGARRGARAGRPGGPGPGHPVRRPRRQRPRRPRAPPHRRPVVKARHPYDVIRRGVVLVPGRPPARPAAAALGPREHRGAAVQPRRPVGTDQRPRGAATGAATPSNACRSTSGPRARCVGCPAATSRR